MIRVSAILLTLAVFTLGLGAPALVQAQVGSTIRAQVLDPEGEPIPDVNIEFQYNGETRVPIVRKAKTDKKGYFVRVGLKSGPWTLVLTKEGYKPRTSKTYVSGDARSDWDPIVMAPAPKDTATATSAAQVAAQQAAQEEAVALGKTYEAAVQALTEGRNDDAEALFKEVVAENPAIAPAHYNLGYLSMLKNDAGTAEKEFRLAIAAEPGRPDSYAALSTLMTADGRGQEAYELLQGVAMLMPADGTFQFALGVAASNVGEDEAARSAFEKAAELDPGNVESQYYLGTLAIGRNEIPAAVEYLKKYVAGAAEGAPNLTPARGLLDALKK